MIKLNRTTEYGLIALRHMFIKQSKKDASVTSAREIADTYSLPFEITAKTLQRLKDTSLIQSEQGARGGYTLAKPLDQVNLGEFLEMMEGPQAVVGCTNPSLSQSPCEYHVRCEIKGVMGELNDRVRNFLWSISLADLTEFKNEVVAEPLTHLTSEKMNEQTSGVSVI